jgi:hypothetical protein
MCSKWVRSPELPGDVTSTSSPLTIAAVAAAMDTIGTLSPVLREVIDGHNDTSVSFIVNVTDLRRLCLCIPDLKTPVFMFAQLLHR